MLNSILSDKQKRICFLIVGAVIDRFKMAMMHCGKENLKRLNNNF